MAEQQKIGRYEILEKVGRGGMGVLYRGTDPVLDREVAIKVMLGDFSDGESDARARFFREARAAARLQHRNIVTIFEFAEEDGVPYIVMEFLRGRSLSSRMAAEPLLTVDQSLDVLIQLCTGLQFAHENGVVHRDVKPGNVWLLEDGTVKLLDFGIAKVAASTMTRGGDVLGSACYMSPEQISSKPVDGRADVFSAGVVLYEMLAHRKPFDAESPTAALMKIVQEEPVPIGQVVPGLPQALADALAKALKKNPEERYQTAGEFGTDLYLIRLALQGSSDTIVSPDGIGDTLRLPGTMTRVAVPPAATVTVRTAPQAPPPPPTPHRFPWPAIAIACVVLLAAVIWFAFARTSKPAVTSGATAATAAAPAQPPSDPKAPADRQKAPADRQSATPGANGAPRPAASAVLHVESEPDGASIVLDGRATGLLTPADVPLNGRTPKRIRLTKSGFQTVDMRLSAQALESGVAKFSLPASVASMVKVSISGSYPFQVFEGGRQISDSDTSHEISVADAHVIRLRAESYLLDYVIKVSGGSDHAMEVRAPELGRVTIRSTMETCRVVVGGFDLGYPPITAQAIAAGTHSVQLRCPDGQNLHSAAITIVAGQTLLVKVP